MSDLSWKACERQIGIFAYKVLRRAHAAGLRTVEREDIIQELAFAWMTACEKYQPDQGVPFQAYLAHGMKLHINRWFKNVARVDGMTPVSLDMPSGDDSAAPLHEAFASDEDTQDITLEQQDFCEEVFARISETSRKVLELLISPPVELVQIVDANKAREEYGKTLGLKSWAPKTITLPMVFSLLGINDPRERTSCRREIERAITQATGTISKYGYRYE